MTLVLFADGTFYLIGIDLTEITKLAHDELKTLDRWFTINKLAVYRQKLNMSYFIGNEKIYGYVDLKLCKTLLERVG